jgi:hypothetical protein
MKVRTSLLLALCVAAAVATGAAAQRTDADQAALRERIEASFDIVPLSDGLALRPKARRGDVRLIEVTDTIAINGTPVSGGELRERLGDAADAVLQLSYLEPAARRALFESAAEEPPAVLPREEPDETLASEPTRDERSRRRARGDRVRVFGSVHVREDESISGQAVAVLGSVRVDGEVGDQVVAVLGSVDLGPNAVVGGDIVSVGGRVRRDPGAQVRGSVTEVALGAPGTDVHIRPWGWMAGWDPVAFVGPWGAMPRFMGTVFRMVLLMLLAGLALLLARSAVENSAQRVGDDPLKATLVGIVAQILAIPVFFLTAMVLVITVIGIPLLLLLPFALLFLLLLALVGFTGTAAAIGARARRRMNLAVDSPFLDVAVGIVAILLVLLVGRLLAIAGLGPFAFLLAAAGFGIEYLAWACGFGAVLMNLFARWQSRRTVRAPVVATPETPPA